MRFPEFHVTKWRLTLLLFALFYAILVALNMNNLPLQWDEVNHFNGAVLLLRGDFAQYIGINSFYPPIYNLVTVAYFAVAGASVFTGRLVALTFTLLSMLVIYRVGKEMYSESAGVVSAVLFAVMPGIVLLSSTAMMETMLIFTFVVSMLYFYKWLQTNRQRDITLSIIAFAVGVVVKYQTLVLVPIIMVLCLLISGKGGALRAKISDFVHSRRVWLIGALAAVAGVLLYVFYASGLLSVWLYAIQVGNAGQAVYSNRFPAPIFYFIEMVWPYNDKHPLSPLLYGLAFVGLAFFALRRKPQDKFLLIWFIVTFVVFTLISNRQWRYVTLLFPVLAISSAELAASIYSRAQSVWRNVKNSLVKKHLAKAAAGLTVMLLVVGVYFSAVDAYNWVGGNQTYLPIDQATNYVASRVRSNQSIVVLCAHNLFSKDMVWFYLNNKGASQTIVYQYPDLAVDAYSPEFNVTYLVDYCQRNGTAYAMLNEYGGNVRYFNSHLTEEDVSNMLDETGRFTQEAAFGVAPQRIFVFSFK